MSRLLILLLVLLAVDIYAFQAVRVLIQHWSAGARQWVYGFYWLVPLLGLGLLLLANSYPSADWPRGWFSFVRALFFIIYLSKFLVVGVLLIDDLRRVLMAAYQWVSPQQEVNLGRNRFLSQLALALGGVPLFLLTYGMARNPYRYQLVKERLRIHRLPSSLEGLRIVQISDIHSGSFTSPTSVARAIDIINAQDADLVFFTGDLVNNKAEEMLPYIDIFKGIKSKHGIFSIFGNHDYGDYVSWPSAQAKEDNLTQLKDVHRQLGWDLLLNENRLLSIAGEQIAIIGVENYSALPRFPKHGKLPEAYQGTEQAALKILLSHDPTHWDYEVTKSYPDIQLTLSGHTHGMQFGIEIPGWLKWSPAQYVYKQWAGAYQQNDQWLYVNRGFGFLGYPGRVGILPEITRLELVA